MGLLGRHHKISKWLGILFIGIPASAEAWAGLFIEEPLIPYLIKRVGGVDMSSNMILIVLPFVVMAIGVILLTLIWREGKIKRHAIQKLDLGKLLLDGKEILVDLEKAIALKDSWDKMAAELKCEMWYKDASKTLQNTDYDRLWFKNKEGLDYRTANKSDYVEACKYGLGRLEYIKQLIFDKEGSQIE